jgi:hypothetical protein
MSPICVQHFHRWNIWSDEHKSPHYTFIYLCTNKTQRPLFTRLCVCRLSDSYRTMMGRFVHESQWSGTRDMDHLVLSSAKMSWLWIGNCNIARQRVSTTPAPTRINWEIYDAWNKLEINKMLQPTDKAFKIVARRSTFCKSNSIFLFFLQLYNILPDRGVSRSYSVPPDNAVPQIRPR